MKHYVASIASPERCRELGVQYEGLLVRFRLWLVGVGMGMSYVSDKHLVVRMVMGNNIRFVCDSSPVVNNIRDAWEKDGVSITEVPS